MSDKKYYYIDIEDLNIDIEGEILVVLDDSKTPIWHHDQSDYYLDLGETIPRDLSKMLNGADLDPLESPDKKCVKRIKTYLSEYY